MVDDLGYGDLSSFGNKEFTTPNIDSFVNQGLKFTNAYAAAPYCSPTRVALMTGKYPGKFEIGLREPLTLSPNDLELGLSPEIPTLTSILKKNNYETALFGKWHLGQKAKYLPSKHGVDRFFGIMCGAADHIDHKPFDRNRDLLFKREIPNLYENDTPTIKKGYLNNLITDYSLDFISERHDKPFFLSIQFTAPHWPWQSPTDSPVDSISYSSSGSKKIYESMLQNLDENFGKIMRTLKKANLDESTLVIFTNDNGGARFANQGKLKGMKGSLYEGGIRVPAAVRWPSVTMPNTTTEQAIITMDWTKTILEAANCIDSKRVDFDGINLKKYCKDPSKVDERTLFWRITNRKQEFAVRKGTYKYLRNKDGEFLYEIQNDISENMDLKTTEPNILKELKLEGDSLNNTILNPQEYK
jgi:arylsulfatase A-like enzyme